MPRLQKQGLINKFFSIANKCKNWLVLIPLRFLPAHVRLNHSGSAFRESRLLYLAVKLDLADLLADLAVPVDLLAKESDISAGNLYRILRALVSMGIFKETLPRVFANNRLSFLLCRTNKHNFRQQILRENNATKSNLWFNKFAARLHVHADKHAIGIEHNRSKQGYSGFSRHEPSGKVNIFEGVDLSTFDLVFDSGNASGDHIHDMLLSSNDLNICIYDSAAAIRRAKMFWQGEHVQHANIRLSFEQGDMFTSLPKASSKHNLYCFVGVFSGLSDNDCLNVLNNAKVAIANFDATVVIVDTVLPNVGLHASDALDDIQLLFENSGGHRTLNQWQKLITQSDFILGEVVELRSSNKILVLRKT